MIGKLNHVAIVVPDLATAADLYRNTFGSDVSDPVDLPAQGVTTVFVNLPNTKIELLHPLGEDSPVAKFLLNNPKGGMHHVCYEVTDLGGAIESLTQALVLAPELPKTHYFYALALKSRGDYDEALKHLEKTVEAYPRDRVARNQVGRIFFLQKKYKDAIHALQEVLRIDPEDLQAHYNLMLSYRGLGDMDHAIKEQTLYMRFKADEASQTITGAARRQNPEANNERQPIHEHVSVPLPWEANASSLPSGERL